MSISDSFVSFSIVSHGQGRLIAPLLDDFRSYIETDFEILLTLNIPEDEVFFESCRDLPITIIRNKSRKGFGANHNAAFAKSTGNPFVIVNPDVRLAGLNMGSLLSSLRQTGVGACGPIVVSSGGDIQDSARRFPTWRRIWRRVVSSENHADYAWATDQVVVDWVAGMFVAFNRVAFEQVGGFDERFFMYFEDADICRRMSKLGWSTILQPGCSIVHDAQRASRRNLKHLSWQIQSCLRFLSRG